MSWFLRTPDLDDAAEIARLHVSTWQETYGDLLPPDFFNADHLAQRQAMWVRNLTSSRPEYALKVAQDGERIVGFALAGPSQGDAPRPRELHMIYLAKTHHGSGAGQALLDATLGTDPAVLWVAKGNTRAEAFYARNGFALDGTEERDPRVPAFIGARMVR